MRSRGACLIRTVGTNTKAFQAKNKIKSLRSQLQLQLLCFLWIFFFFPVLTLKSSVCSFRRWLKQGQTEAFLVKSSSGSRLVLTKTTAEENNPTARFMIRSCKDTQKVDTSVYESGRLPPTLLCQISIIGIVDTFSQTAGGSYPCRGLPEQRSVVQAAGAIRPGGEVIHGCFPHTHAYTARPPGSQQHRLLETPAQCRMLSRKLAAAQSRGWGSVWRERWRHGETRGFSLLHLEEK